MSSGSGSVRKIPGVPKLHIHGLSEYERTASTAASSPQSFVTRASDFQTAESDYHSSCRLNSGNDEEQEDHPPPIVARTNRVLNNSAGADHSNTTSGTTHSMIGKNPMPASQTHFSNTISSQHGVMRHRHNTLHGFAQTDKPIFDRQHWPAADDDDDHSAGNVTGPPGPPRIGSLNPLAGEPRDSSSWLKNSPSRFTSGSYLNSDKGFGYSLHHHKAPAKSGCDSANGLIPGPNGDADAGDSDALRKFLLEQRKVRCKLAELAKADVISDDDSCNANNADAPHLRSPLRTAHVQQRGSSDTYDVCEKGFCATPEKLVSNMRSTSIGAGAENRPGSDVDENGHRSSDGLNGGRRSDQEDFPSVLLNRNRCRLSQSPPIAILESLSGHDESFTEYDDSSDSLRGPSVNKPPAASFSRVLGHRRESSHRDVDNLFRVPTPQAAAAALNNNVSSPRVETAGRHDIFTQSRDWGIEEESSGEDEMPTSISPRSSRWMSRHSPFYNPPNDTSQNDFGIQRAYSLMRKDPKAPFRVNPLAVLGRCDSFSQSNHQQQQQQHLPLSTSSQQEEGPSSRLGCQTAAKPDQQEAQSSRNFVDSRTREAGVSKRASISMENADSHPTAPQNILTRATINRRYTHTGTVQAPAAARPLNRQLPNLNLVAHANGLNGKHNLVRSLISGSAMVAIENTDSDIDTLKNIISPGASSTQRSVRSSFVGDSTDKNGLSATIISANLQRELLNTGIPLKSIINQFEIGFALVSAPGEVPGYITVPGVTPAELIRKGFNLHRINSGTFCSVFKARYRQYDVAVKCPDENLLKSDSEMMRCRALQEWSILSRTSHQHILNFHGGVVVKDQIWLVTDYIRGGDLYTLLYHRVPEILRPVTRLDLMEQLCAALAYLHTLKPKIAHKDIKCNNLLVGEDMKLRVCDFGDAEEMSGPYLQRCTAATWQYTPPELIGTEDPSRPKGATEQVDVWAMGCVFLEILKCSTPFVHILDRVAEDRQRSILRQCYLENRLEEECNIPASLPPEIKKIISLCLCFNPKKRPLSVEVLNLISKKRDELLYEISAWQNRWEKKNPLSILPHSRQFSQESTLRNGSINEESSLIKLQPSPATPKKHQQHQIPISPNKISLQDEDPNGGHSVSARGAIPLEHRIGAKLHRENSHHVPLTPIHSSLENIGPSATHRRPSNARDTHVSPELNIPMFHTNLARPMKNHAKVSPQQMAWDKGSWKDGNGGYKIVPQNRPAGGVCLAPSIATITKNPVASSQSPSWDHMQNGRLLSNGVLIAEKRSPRPAVKDQYGECGRVSNVDTPENMRIQGIDPVQIMADRKIFAHNFLRSNGPPMAVSRNITDTAELKKLYVQSRRGLRGEVSGRDRDYAVHRGVGQCLSTQKDSRGVSTAGGSGGMVRKAPLVEAIYGNVMNGLNVGGEDATHHRPSHELLSKRAGRGLDERDMCSEEAQLAGKTTRMVAARSPSMMAHPGWGRERPSDMANCRARSQEMEEATVIFRNGVGESTQTGTSGTLIDEGSRPSSQTKQRIQPPPPARIMRGSRPEVKAAPRDQYGMAVHSQQPVPEQQQFYKGNQHHVLTPMVNNSLSKSTCQSREVPAREISTIFIGKSPSGLVQQQQQAIKKEYTPSSREDYPQTRPNPAAAAAPAPAADVNGRIVFSSHNGRNMPTRLPRYAAAGNTNGMDSASERLLVVRSSYGRGAEKDEGYRGSQSRQNLVADPTVLNKKELLQSLLSQPACSALPARPECAETVVDHHHPKSTVRLTTRSRPQPLAQQLKQFNSLVLNERNWPGGLQPCEPVHNQHRFGPPPPRAYYV